MTVIWNADQPLSVRVVRERLDYQSADGEDPAYTTVHVRDGDPLTERILGPSNMPGSSVTAEPGGTRPHQPRRPPRHHHPPGTRLRPRPSGRLAPGHPVTRIDHARHSRCLDTGVEHAVIALDWPDWARFELGWRADAGR
jgi:hypothetical protein